MMAGRGFRILGTGVLLFSLILTPVLLSQPYDQIDRETFNTIYRAGRVLFYKILRERIPSLQLDNKNREILLEASINIPGVYEHLMNFYYFHEGTKEDKQTKFRTRFLNLSQNMAEEFIQSISDIIPREEFLPLQSLLRSIGYFTRKMSPQYRKYIRPLAKQTKGQWALKDLEVRKVHSLSKGKGIKLAIIDSGVDPTIREIKGRIIKWKDFLGGSKPVSDKGRFPYDWGGHGTSITSVAIQVAPEVELIIVKVTDDETMRSIPITRWTACRFAAGMVWAAQNGADIINISAAFSTDTKPIREASEFCWKKNVVVVSPLANVEKNQQAKIPYFPASYPWAIAVGGVEKRKGKLRLYPYSSEGNYIDVVAPASGIVVEVPSYLDRRTGLRTAAGNSLAVPFVAGTAAIILSVMDDQTITNLKEKPGELVETVMAILRQTSSNKKLGLNTPNPASGYGLINIQKAVRIAKNLRIHKDK